MKKANAKSRMRLHKNCRTAKPRGISPTDGTRYRITLVSEDELKLIERPKKRMGAQAPRYDRARDEPGFDAAWKYVAELRAQGKLTPIPPFPKGGLKLRGSRQKESA